MTFKEWIEHLDAIITKHAGVPLHYLRDYDYREAYEHGANPADTACTLLGLNWAGDSVINEVREEYGINGN